MTTQRPSTPIHSTRSRIALLPLLMSLVAIAGITSLASCASYSYSAALRPAQDEILNGEPESALGYMNTQLGVDSDEEVPNTIEGGRALPLLERGTLLQSLGKYKESQRDMGLADERLEYLDIDAYDRVEITKWLFSDSSELYRAPAYERLLLNILNIINYLATKNLEGARVEVRRFVLLVDFFTKEKSDTIDRGVIALGYYLAGFTYERSRDYANATYYYSNAYRYGIATDKLKERLIDLMRVSGNFTPLDNEASLVSLSEAAKSLGRMSVDEFRSKYSKFDLLVVAQTGMAPYKSTSYIPLGAAISLSSPFLGASRDQANALLAQGLLTTVNVPVLVSEDVPYDPPFTLKIGHNPIRPIDRVDITGQIERSWKAIQPKVVGSALTRTLTRIVASQAAEAGVKASGEDGSLGKLAGMLIQGGMSLADTPDTRSWMFLPSTIYLFRTTLPAGQHTVTFGISLGKESVTVLAKPETFQLINFSKYRQ